MWIGLPAQHSISVDNVNLWHFVDKIGGKKMFGTTKNTRKNSLQLTRWQGKMDNLQPTVNTHQHWLFLPRARFFVCIFFVVVAFSIFCDTVKNTADNLFIRHILRVPLKYFVPYLVHVSTIWKMVISELLSNISMGRFLSIAAKEKARNLAIRKKINNKFKIIASYKIWWAKIFKENSLWFI